MEKVAPSERFRRELDEVSEFLGRSRYERAEDTVSHRNGYEPKTVKTTSGAMRSTPSAG
jgi:transposase-like protein